MRITITLQKDDALTFTHLHSLAENMLVDRAVLARHYFLKGMKLVALSADRHADLVRQSPELSAAAAKARSKEGKGKR